MSIYLILQQLVVLESLIELDAAVARELKLNKPGVMKAYDVSPSRAVDPVVPCFMNWPDVSSEARMGNFREDTITIQIDFLAAQPETPNGGLIAAAFFDKVLMAFDSERPVGRRLGGSVDYLTIRAERPMIETIDWNGKSYPGFHIFLDMTAFTESTVI